MPTCSRHRRFRALAGTCRRFGCRRGLLFLLLAAALQAAPAPGEAQVTCSELEAADLPRVVITGVEHAPADDARGWPAHCVVSGAIEGRIRFVLHLPVAEAWNGKFLMGGGGGFAGVVSNQALGAHIPGGDALQRGYATIGTDTGHRGRGPSPTLDGSWAVDDWPALVDFGYRAVHETALLGQVLAEKRYGRAARYSYFYGCSNGGRQALMEAQRHPHTFDGIVAGASGLDFANMILHFVRVARAMFPDGDPERPVLSEARLRELGEAVLAECDVADGVEDGIVSDPAGCAFDPRTHLPGFSEAELRAVEAVYAPLYVGGRRVHPGYPPGHETASGGWDLRITGHGRPGGPVNHAATEQFVAGIFMNDATLRLADAPPLEELLVHSTMPARVLHAANPDLRAVQEAGGKLIMFHGWADFGVSAYTSTDYHRRVVELFGDQDVVDDFLRLFMLPGMGHCTGGAGPDRVDWLTALERWVEEDHAPDGLVAVKVDEEGDVIMSRPVCRYPRRAHHVGSDRTHAESFECRDP